MKHILNNIKSLGEDGNEFALKLVVIGAIGLIMYVIELINY